ncbi:MAG: HAMP domain-containing sensor histidine kinase, partial [Proteobacteria bacterium]|nr:HAMP domain-containing sensor histidine kinase [Pseudomonadota bacterium]
VVSLTLLAMLLSMILAYLISGRLVSRVQYILSISKRINDTGDLSLRLNLAPDADEIASLGAQFDSMLQSLEEAQENLVHSQRHEAVATMTQMLAHDVRKPFSILRMGLGMLNRAQDPAGVRKVLASLIPEIDKAVGSVDGLIADVMEVGSTSAEFIQEAVSPESLIETCLGQLFRIYPKADISIAYDLQHTHMVHVHAQKVGRVFSNIVGNALQAMKYRGAIWFKTIERDGAIEFCLGNAGSLISPEHLPKLFDAFITHGKKGGTGQ